MKTIKFALAGALLAAGMASPVAVADPDKGNAEAALAFCKAYSEAFPEDYTVGQCMAVFRGDDSAAIQRYCRDYDRIIGLENSGVPGVTNVGQCIKYLRG